MRGIDELVRQVSGRSYAVLNGRLLLDGGDLDLLIALAEEAVAARGRLDDTGGEICRGDLVCVVDRDYANARRRTDECFARLGAHT